MGETYCLSDEYPLPGLITLPTIGSMGETYCLSDEYPLPGLITLPTIGSLALKALPLLRSSSLKQVMQKRKHTSKIAPFISK
jgi:hypothetical protein